MHICKPNHPPIAPPSSLGPVGPVHSALVLRLIEPGIDSGRRRIRRLLIQLPDARLRAGLGLSDADVAALRAASLGDLALMGATATESGLRDTTASPVTESV